MIKRHLFYNFTEAEYDVSDKSDVPFSSLSKHLSLFVDLTYFILLLFKSRNVYLIVLRFRPEVECFC